MSNIAIGIGLSGKEKADLRGLEYLVGAEKDMAGQREAKKKAEDAAKQKLIDDVMKNTAFKQQFGNAFFQKEFERDAAARMAKIIEPMMSGQTDYTNIAVLAHNEISALERANRERKIEDDSMTNMNKAFLAKPSEVFMSDPRTIDGKTYNSPQQFLNSNADNPNAAQMMSDNWGGANWFMVANPSPELGRTSILFNPEMALTMDPIEEGTKFLKSGGVFNVPGAERFMKEGRTTVKYQGLLPDENSILRTNAHLFSDPRFGNTALLSAYTDARQQKPDLNYSEWLSGINLEETVNTYADSVMNTLKNYEGDRMQVSDTRPAPQQSVPSSGSLFESKKVAVFSGDDIIKAQEMQPWEDKSSTGQKYQYLAVAPIQLKQGVSMNIDIKSGTLYWDKNLNNGKGSLRAPDNYESTEKVIPHEMVFMSDGQKGQPYIRYLLAVSPTGGSGEDQGPFAEQSSGDRFKTKAYESFYVPATEENLKRLAAATETSLDEWNKLKIELGKRSSSGRQAASSGGQSVNQAGQAPTGQQSPTSGAIGQTAKKAESSSVKSTTSLTKTQKDALSAFEAQLGRKPTETEKAKILEKYK